MDPATALDQDIRPHLQVVADRIGQAVQAQAPSGMGPWDAPARHAVELVLLELARGMACCAQGGPADQAASVARLRVLAQHPWAAACLGAAAHPDWCLGGFFPALAQDTVHLAQANARFRDWVTQAL